MPSPKIVCVVPTVRPECHAKFVEAWSPLFEKHSVTLVTVWDGDEPSVQVQEWPRRVDNGMRPYVEYNTQAQSHVLSSGWLATNRDLFCRYTDACRNIGFAYTARFLDFDVVMTLDDDVYPRAPWPPTDRKGPHTDYYLRKYHRDPIQEHLSVLGRSVCTSWLSTALPDKAHVPTSFPQGSSDDDSTDYYRSHVQIVKPVYMRGFPYGLRDEATVAVSHGVWDGVPDWDGETQLELQRTGRGDYQPKYFVGPVPKGVKFPMCGMNLMFTKEVLPYVYFAPMGKDADVWADKYVNNSGRQITKGELVTSDMVGVEVRPALHRFADIFMGLFLKDRLDELQLACYTGASTVYHSRASDPVKNFEQEKLGREWLELMCAEDTTHPAELTRYLRSYRGNRMRYESLIRELLRRESPGG